MGKDFRGKSAKGAAAVRFVGLSWAVEPRNAGATGGSFGPPVPMPLGPRMKSLAGQSPRQWHPERALFG